MYVTSVTDRTGVSHQCAMKMFDGCLFNSVNGWHWLCQCTRTSHRTLRTPRKCDNTGRASATQAQQIRQTVLASERQHYGWSSSAHPPAITERPLDLLQNASRGREKQRTEETRGRRRGAREWSFRPDGFVQLFFRSVVFLSTYFSVCFFPACDTVKEPACEAVTMAMASINCSREVGLIRWATNPAE